MLSKAIPGLGYVLKKQQFHYWRFNITKYSKKERKRKPEIKKQKKNIGMELESEKAGNEATDI